MSWGYIFVSGTINVLGVFVSGIMSPGGNCEWNS